jgi:hypothetical protein
MREAAGRWFCDALPVFRGGGRDHFGGAEVDTSLHRVSQCEEGYFRDGKE